MSKIDKIIINSKLLVDHPIIDREHVIIIDAVNEIIDMHNDDESQISNIFDKLVVAANFLEEHFKRELDILKANEFPYLKGHQVLYYRLLANIKNNAVIYNESKQPMQLQLIVDMVKTFLPQHVLHIKSQLKSMKLGMKNN